MYILLWNMIKRQVSGKQMKRKNYKNKLIQMILKVRQSERKQHDIYCYTEQISILPQGSSEQGVKCCLSDFSFPEVVVEQWTMGGYYRRKCKVSIKKLQSTRTWSCFRQIHIAKLSELIKCFDERSVLIMDDRS